MAVWADSEFLPRAADDEGRAALKTLLEPLPGLTKARSSRTWLSCIAFLMGSVSTAAPIAIINTQSLGFGKFAANTGGSITISPAGARSSSGGVALISSGTGSAARFTVSGDLVAYSILLPPNGMTSLSGPSGATMALNNFTSVPNGAGTLSGGGSQIVNVGATLSVGVSQTPGAYTGTFSVTVDYH